MALVSHFYSALRQQGTETYQKPCRAEPEVSRCPSSLQSFQLLCTSSSDCPNTLHLQTAPDTQTFLTFLPSSSIRTTSTHFLSFLLSFLSSFLPCPLPTHAVAGLGPPWLLLFPTTYSNHAELHNVTKDGSAGQVAFQQSPGWLLICSHIITACLLD